MTGGSGGIGLALCKSLTHGGAIVCSLDIRPPEEPVRGVVFLKADITKDSQIKRALLKVPPKIGILISNAGIMRRGNLFQTSEKELDLLFNTNVKGSWLMIKHIQSKLQDNSIVVQVSSGHALHPEKDPGIYSLTKQTAFHFAELLKITSPNLAVKTAFPGPVDTHLLSYGRSKEDMERVRTIAATPKRLAELILDVILSDKSKLVFDEKKWKYVLG